MGDKDKWRQLATEMGFEFKEGINAFLDSPTLRQMAGEIMNRRDLKPGDMEKAEKLLRNPMMQKLINAVFIGAAAGGYKDFEFALFRSSSSGSSSGSSTRYVNISMLFKQKLHSEFLIYSSGGLTKLGKMLMPGKYVKIPNNPDLDKMIAVRAEDKTQASTYLSDGRWQDKLMKLFTASNNYQVSEYGVRYKQRGRVIEKEQALPLMDLMVEVGRSFSPR